MTTMEQEVGCEGSTLARIHQLEVCIQELENRIANLASVRQRWMLGTEGNNS